MDPYHSVMRDLMVRGQSTAASAAKGRSRWGRAVRWCAASATILLGACSAAPQPLVPLPPGVGGVVNTSAPDVVGPLQLRGRQLVDATGRVVIIHGVNSVRKSEPYISPLTNGWLGPDDLASFERDGFTGVRLGVWAAKLMPSPGVIDTDYLDQVAEVVDTLAQHHLWVLLDFHQDVFSGMPSWATLPQAAALSDEAPEFLKPIGWSASYFSPRSLRQWRDWWSNAPLANGRGVVDTFGDGIEAVAARFADATNLIGLELLNEPFPDDTHLAACLGGDCPALGKLMSKRFTELTNRVRQVAPSMPVWWEPVTLSVLSPLPNLDISGVDAGPNGQQVGLSFHTYCLGTDGGEPTAPSAVEVGLCNPAYGKAFEHARGFSKKWDVPAMMTEFGASASPLNVTEPARLADADLTSWLHWHYPFGGTTDPPGVVRSQLVRTYAQATAGNPVEQRFDPASGRFLFRYQPDFTVTAPTSIVVPAPQYPNGYVATVAGGHVTSSANAGHLTVVADTGAAEVTVEVTRA